MLSITKIAQGRLRYGVAGILGLSLASVASAATYNGNGAAGFNGAIGNGSLSITESGSNITFTLNNSTGFSGNDFVLYLDTVAGGFADTSQFADNGDGGREAVSAYNNGTNKNNGAASGNVTRESVTFPTGFGADYALEFENDTYDGLFGLVAGGDNSLNYVTGNGPSTAGGPYIVTVPLADLQLSSGQSFSFDGDLISTSAYGSNETIGASTTSDGTNTGANPGFSGSLTFTSADTFTPAATPEPTSLGLLGTGVLTAFGFRRNRRTASI